MTDNDSVVSSAVVVQFTVGMWCAGCSCFSLPLAGDLSLEELMAKYGYVSQEVEEDASDSSDGDSECCSSMLDSDLYCVREVCCVCACVRTHACMCDR